MPKAGAPLLDAFDDLSHARSYNGAGPSPITCEARAAWSQVMRVLIEPRHAEVVMALDPVWLDAAYRLGRQAPGGIETLPPISAQPLTATLGTVPYHRLALRACFRLRH